mmetsp:Transcript_13848/g.39815  ORF Transcript_13848/g.39815 Transcript_13848/m.39815 type:complete len:107 (+) Transcript_13848:2160-2480(+)
MNAAAIQSAVATTTQTPPHAKLHEGDPLLETAPPASTMASSRSGHGSVQNALLITVKLRASMAPTAICNPPSTPICVGRLRAPSQGQHVRTVQSLNTATKPNTVEM